MKQTIKNFFTKKRFKVLKNNKGFSLLEVLVGVSIIGIISAIAVPTFQSYRESASLTAGSTTTNNILKAYQSCIVLKEHSSCDTLAEININCQDCQQEATPHASKFCAWYDKSVGSKDFRMCVNVDGNTIARTVGGDFEVCHEECTGARANSADPCWNTPTTATVFSSGIKLCTQSTLTDDCGTAQTNWTFTCAKRSGANAGTCSSGDCQ